MPDPTPSPQIDVAAATAALEAAGGMPEVMPSAGNVEPFRRGEDGRFTSKPAEPATPSAEVPAETVDPAATQDPGTAAPEETPFTHIDDSALSPELLQLKRSLQADYTRKTQEIAPWRKLGDELGLQGPDDFRQAGEIYTRLQDPRNWPTFHKEISSYMEQYGMSPAEANVAAAEKLAEFAPTSEEAFVDPSAGGYGDESLAPVMHLLNQQSQQIQQLMQRDQQREQQSAQAESQRQIAEHLSRQEASIRTQNPEYSDDDMGAIYQLMQPDGDLVAAQARYESLIGGRLSRYIASKQSAHDTTPHVLPGGTVDTQPQTREPMSMDQAHKAAMAHIVELERGA